MNLKNGIRRAGGIFLILLFLFSASAEETFTANWDKRTEGLDPAVKDHLKLVLGELSKIETGQFLLKHVFPDVRFSARPMAQLGVATTENVITLEQLRLENRFFPATTERQQKGKICFTAEILAHELLHNAQFRAGLLRPPDNFSGLEASLCERLLEMQAKYTGEKSFFLLSAREEYRSFVSPKPGLFLVTERRSKEGEKEYEETLWRNAYTFADGSPIYKEQKREIVFWNSAYAEQAFLNNYGRFLADLPGAGESALRSRLDEILRFTAMPVSADFLIRNSPVRAIPHGLACWENGKKVLELEASKDSYLIRRFNGDILTQEKRVPIRR